jgi:hypothetical protein
MGMVGVGKFTMKNKEHPVVIHEYKGALLHKNILRTQSNELDI